MDEQAIAYLEYLLEFREVQKPSMPKFDLSAYNDNEYTLAVEEINREFDKIDDFDIALRYLQGE